MYIDTSKRISQFLVKTQKLEEAKYSIIFAESEKRFVASIQWKATVFYFIMPQK